MREAGGSVKTEAGSAFGLIVIGSEILDGRVKDKHVATTQALLRKRRLETAYVQILPDDPGTIETQLRWAMGRAEPFFCCGGIGGTPDDYTRGCAARAAGVPVEPHPEGVAMLRERYGADATPARLRMVEFPQGAALIPNPVNRVPGFRIRNGHFLPGFPSMAAPMTAWVLDTWFEHGPERTAAALVLPGAREADLTCLMELFIAAHPEVRFSSLPRLLKRGTEVRLGVAGAPECVARGVRDLKAALDAAGIAYRAAR
ncbi:MAG: competence/damage-inducible protein A [Lentisphaerae bacterium]|nr:competence/damage-inducible protein A [Lentisphaerota bacterium]